MHSAISMNKTEVLDSVLSDFSEVRFLTCEFEFDSSFHVQFLTSFLGNLGLF